MNDRYLFKAKGNPKYNTGEWYVGYLAKDSDGDFFIRGDGWERSVIEDTICQCTGLKDNNGNLIWENDVLECYGTVKYEHFLTQVEWDDSASCFLIQEKINSFVGLDSIGKNGIYSCKVIGNIFDNPELLEVE